MSKCVSCEAKNFEKKLEELEITYNQFLELKKMHHELTVGGKAEVDDLLKN